MSDPSDIYSDLPQCLIDEQWHDDTVLLDCSGVIDMLTAPEVQRRIDTALTKQPAAMILDLTRVEFLTSHGMSVLVTTSDQCAGKTAFTVVADGPATSRPMQIVGLDQIITLVPTLDDARRTAGV